MSNRSQARPYINPYLAGVILGIVLFLAFFFTGSGLGASGGLNRWVWDLRHARADRRGPSGPWAVPGAYTLRATRAGTSGRALRRGATFPWTRFAARARALSPSKAGPPARHS